MITNGVPLWTTLPRANRVDEQTHYKNEFTAATRQVTEPYVPRQEGSVSEQRVLSAQQSDDREPVDLTASEERKTKLSIKKRIR